MFIGQITRAIGVRFTLRTWNLTTHEIDPDLDVARENVVGDLLDTDHVSRVGYAAGAEVHTRTDPGRNVTGDPFWTDGLRAVVAIEAGLAEPRFFEWEVAP